jgi:hypothetical protein
MYDNRFWTFRPTGGPDWLNISLTVLSLIVAIGSAYIAVKALRQSRESQIPMLLPMITDVSNPQILRFEIQNVGNGVAKNIKAEIRPTGYLVPFDTDLLPIKFADRFQKIGNETTIAFSGGDNPLFNKGELYVTYEDIWGQAYWMRAVFKPDAHSTRHSIGHVDQQFSGIFYGPI